MQQGSPGPLSGQTIGSMHHGSSTVPPEPPVLGLPPVLGPPPVLGLPPVLVVPPAPGVPPVPAPTQMPDRHSSPLSHDPSGLHSQESEPAAQGSADERRSVLPPHASARRAAIPGTRVRSVMARTLSREAPGANEMRGFSREKWAKNSRNGQSRRQEIGTPTGMADGDGPRVAGTTALRERPGSQRAPNIEAACHSAAWKGASRLRRAIL